MNQLKQLNDSGERQIYESGAMRDNSVGKGRFDLIPFQAMMRLAKHYEAGALKYTPRNFEIGMPISRYLDAAFRHLYKYLAGYSDEDHLSAVAWNIFAIMHHEYHRKEMQDLPNWQGRESPFIEKENVESLND
jgi:hypothetical protein